MVTRLSGGLTPADGADPRTFPAIWNTTAGTIESQGSAITVAEGDIASQGSAIAVLEGDSIPTNVTSPVSGDSLVYDGTDWVNGPRSGNAVINGDFGVWQRGTSFSGPSAGYTADRWRLEPSTATVTVTRQSFTPADLSVLGYGDAEYFLRADVTVLSGTPRMEYRIEDVRTFAGQTVTLSFWAKSGSAKSIRVVYTQNFGSGGSADVTNIVETVNTTSSWQRFTTTFTVPSVSGKTIGASSFFQPRLDFQGGADTFDLWGVQLEAGSVATPFRLAGGGSKGAELALCQRYYVRFDAQAVNNYLAQGMTRSSTVAVCAVEFPTTMRTSPQSLLQTGTAADYEIQRQGPTNINLSVVPTHFGASKSKAYFGCTVSSGLVGGEAVIMRASATGADAFLAYESEL